MGQACPLAVVGGSREGRQSFTNSQGAELCRSGCRAFESSGLGSLSAHSVGEGVVLGWRCSVVAAAEHGEGVKKESQPNHGLMIGVLRGFRQGRKAPNAIRDCGGLE